MAEEELNDNDNDNDSGKELLSRRCYICGKIFESNYILNYHKLLEHSGYKRPPIGIG